MACLPPTPSHGPAGERDLSPSCPGLRFQHCLAEKFYADAVFMIARDASRGLGDQDKLADRRTNLRSKRNPVHRDVDDLAGKHLAIGPGEGNAALALRPFTPSQDGA